MRERASGRGIAGIEIVQGETILARTDAQGRFRASARRWLGGAVTTRSREHCPASVNVDAASQTVHVDPRFELPRDAVQVGFDREVTLVVRGRCADDARFGWAQTSGRSLEERMRVSADGKTLTLRTHPMSDFVTLDARIGPIAMARESRGDYRFTLTIDEGGSRTAHEVRVVAAAASSGLFQVAAGTDLYLNGGEAAEHRWTLLEKPRGSRAEVEGATSRVARIRPDAFGEYVLKHEPSLEVMNVQAGEFDRIPHDCARSQCHTAEDRAFLATKHATTFRRGVEGALGPSFDERCWTCHASGVDHGIPNGGFHESAREFGWPAPVPSQEAWTNAPRQVRRLGPIFCSSCHGPGRIVPPTFRWQYGAKFEADVCARCHDATHDPDAAFPSTIVDEWQHSAMAHFVGGGGSDDPATREGCATCHSAQAFVEYQRRGARFVPDARTVTAIACATCHDPHDATNPAQVRVHDRVDAIGGRPEAGLGSGAMCATCHRTDAMSLAPAVTAPHAPQANVLVGRGARSVPDGAAGAHRGLNGTCTSCHMATPRAGDPMLGRVGGHTFAVRERIDDGTRNGASWEGLCTSCHAPGSSAFIDRDWDGDGTVGLVREEYERALRRAREALQPALARMRDACTPVRVGARIVEHEAALWIADEHGVRLGDCDNDGALTGEERGVPLERAPASVQSRAWDLAMVEKDGSRGVHNPAFVFRVLQSASSR